ncbi:hypothetical protein ACLB2K_002140 [Fragaria x ananassa]
MSSRDPYFQFVWDSTVRGEVDLEMDDNTLGIRSLSVRVLVRHYSEMMRGGEQDLSELRTWPKTNIDKVQAKESFDEWVQRNCKENCRTNAKLYVITHTGVINADGKILQLNEYGVRNSHEPFNDELANHCCHARPASTPLS